MKEQTKINILLNVALVLIIFALIGQVYLIIDSKTVYDAITSISAGFAIVALLSACVYIGTEFKKSSAKYFKFYLYCFILAQLAHILAEIVTGFSTAMLVCDCVEFVLLNILFGVKDLGKLKSLVISGIVLLICIILCLVYSIISSKELGSDATFSLFLLWLTPIALSAVLLIMMVLKYHDKAMRKQQQEENK